VRFGLGCDPHPDPFGRFPQPRSTEDAREAAARTRDPLLDRLGDRIR